MSVAKARRPGKQARAISCLGCAYRAGVCDRSLLARRAVVRAKGVARVSALPLSPRFRPRPRARSAR
eukprot:5053101-Lingulodinium_polyedra.AAC.1